MDYLVDTIAAISTPHGKGGIGVIRVSGTEAIKIADCIFSPYSRQSLLHSRGYSIHLGTIIINDIKIDEVIVLVFRAPRSYTGEDIVEFQCHGGVLVLEQILRGLVDNGARLATAGEFTRRAVVNGRISLSEAEGISEIISAVSKQGEQAAFALSKGSLYRETERMKSHILSLQAAITAYIDFPEEDAVTIEEEELLSLLYDLRQSTKTLLKSYEVGLSILNGITTTIVGAPNVGKSTIMNLLTGYDRSIVTPIPGTTRDVLEHQIDIDGLTLVISDTAGIHTTDNPIEKIGVERAYETIKKSALVLIVFDNSRVLSEEDYHLMTMLNDSNVIAIVNKVDLDHHLDYTEIKKHFSNVIYISAKEEASLAIITDEIKKVARVNEFEVGMPFLVNERQRGAAKNVLEALEDAIESFSSGMTLDVVYICLDYALASLMELSGENVSEEVLDQVFSNFCVGK